MSHTASTPYNGSHPDVLAIYCSDGRFTRAVEELAAESQIDVMCLPGGPGLFDLWSSSAFDARMMEDASSFLITGHHTRKVLLVAHEGCGFYARRYPDPTPGERRARQEADVRRASARLRELHPHLDVQEFFAVVRGTPPHVGFDRLCTSR